MWYLHLYQYFGAIRYSTLYITVDAKVTKSMKDYLCAMKRLAIFASGSGSNAENISTYFTSHPEIRVELVITNRKQAFVLQRMARLGVEARYVPKEDFENGQLIQTLRKKRIDLIVLAGFLKLIPLSLIEAYPNRIINIHPALLPKFGGHGMYGMHVHEAVVNSGDKVSGITIHYINEKFDEGEIIAQFTTELNSGDTPETVAAKIHDLEMKYFPMIIEKICEANL